MEVTNVRLSDGKMVPFYVYEQSMRNVLADAQLKLSRAHVVLEALIRLNPKRGAYGLYYHFNTVNQLKARAIEAQKL